MQQIGHTEAIPAQPTIEQYVDAISKFIDLTERFMYLGEMATRFPLTDPKYATGTDPRQQYLELSAASQQTSFAHLQHLQAVTGLHERPADITLAPLWTGRHTVTRPTLGTIATSFGPIQTKLR